ncbi:MAG: T9SS type A sorting domain-containing protein [Bacteroidota bacterium]
MKTKLLFLCLVFATCSFAQELPEVSISGVGIYPNPFNEQIFVQNEKQADTDKIDKIEIYTEQYHKLLSVTRSNVIDANHLQKGTYFLKIYYPDQVIIRKVVKK